VRSAEIADKSRLPLAVAVISKPEPGSAGWSANKVLCPADFFLAMRSLKIVRRDGSMLRALLSLRDRRYA
jgi:alpha/beta superfamily hydrolase